MRIEHDPSRGARLLLGGLFCLAGVLVSATVPAGKPVCAGGKVQVESGCCWPSQTFEGAQCTGLPRCPTGLLVSNGGCVTKGAYAESLGQACAKLEVGFDHAASAEVPSRRACDELAGMLADAEPAWKRSCDRGDVRACLLLGSALLGYRTASVRVALWVARCPANNCDGYRKSAERLGFLGTKRDAATARAAFEKACTGGVDAACVELAQLGVAKDEPRAVCLARGDVRACSEAVYRIGAVGRVSDSELATKAALVLGARCNEGQGLACNNLGFLNERKLAGAMTMQAALSLYQQGCVLGEAASCASLVMAVMRSPALARTVAWAAAATTLDTACDPASESAREVCLALGSALQRGFGVKADPRRGQKLVARLCASGFTDACVR